MAQTKKTTRKKAASPKGKKSGKKKAKTAVKKKAKTTKKRSRRPTKKTTAKVKSRAKARRARKEAQRSSPSTGKPSLTPLSLEKASVAEVILEREISLSPRSGGPGVCFLGLDLGSRRTVLAASRAGHPVQLASDTFATVVGVPPPGVDIAGGRRHAFGDEAVELQHYVELKYPVREGVVRDMEICSKFVRHLREKLDPSCSIWIVASVPADSTDEQRSRLRQIILGSFDRTFLVPEPYLAAVGMLRDDATRSAGINVRAALSSLVVDIGNESTRLCLLSGGFPERNDQVRLERGGSSIDQEVLSTAHFHTGLKLTPELVRSVKEEQGIVDVARSDGRDRSELLDIAYALGDACEQLLCEIVEAVQELLERRDVDSVRDVAQTILLTGRSCRIPGMGRRLETLLEECDLGRCRVLVPSDHERLVARGALHVAEALSDEEWGTADSERRLQDWEPDHESQASQGRPAADRADEEALSPSMST